MTPRLPLELQLHILELAVPPIIQRRLDERSVLLQILSLVTRSWTAWAQSQLHEHISILHKLDRGTLVRAMKRLEAKEAQGYPLKRVALYFDAGPDARVVVRDAPGIIGQAFEAWLIPNERAMGLHKAVGPYLLSSFAVLAADNSLQAYVGFTSSIPNRVCSASTRITYQPSSRTSTFDFKNFPQLEILVLDRIGPRIGPSGPIKWLQQVMHTPVRVLC